MITIVLLVSRDFLLDRLFARLDELQLPIKTNLLALVDGNGKLFLKTRNLVSKSKFNQTLCVHAFNKENQLRGQSQRRQRIADLHNIAQDHLIACDYVLMLEDDGLPPVDTIKRLYDLHTKYPDAGFVSGAEVGRWLSPYIGGWVFEPVNEPKHLTSVVQNGVQEVTSAGFYACLTKHYKRYKFAPSPNWGPDIEWGLKLSQDGFKNYIDTDLIIDHYNGDKVINPTTKTVKQVRLKNIKGVWRTIHSVAKAV
jgi:hypothetical protein